MEDPPSSQLDCETVPVFWCVRPYPRHGSRGCTASRSAGRAGGAGTPFGYWTGGSRPTLRWRSPGTAQGEPLGGGFRRAAAHPAPAGLAAAWNFWGEAGLPGQPRVWMVRGSFRAVHYVPAFPEAVQPGEVVLSPACAKPCAKSGFFSFPHLYSGIIIMNKSEHLMGASCAAVPMLVMVQDYFFEFST